MSSKLLRRKTAIQRNGNRIKGMEHKVKQDSLVEFQVRTLTQDDFPQVLVLLKQTGWTIGANSIYTWVEIDPEGWKVAFKSSGEIVGVCSAGKLNDDFYQLKYYIVKKEYRRRGIGIKLWNSCMDYIGHRDVCLMAVLNMVENYQNKSGFSYIDTDPIICYQTSDLIQVENLSSELSEGVSIVPFGDCHLKAMMEYDPFCGKNNYKRQRIIELTCKEKDSKTMVAFKAGICVGFGTIKITLSNILTGRPMYADDITIAEVMLKKLLLSFPNSKGLAMRTYASNNAANDLMEKINCPQVKTLYHMYTRRDSTMFSFKNSVHKLFGLLEYDMSDFKNI